MQLLARYLAVIFLQNLLMALLGLTGLFWFQSIITQLNEYPLNQLFVYMSYDLPKTMVMMAPPATLMATVLTFSALSKTNELVAFFSIGISLPQMMGVLLPLVFILGCLSLIAQDRLLPHFHEKRSAFYWREIKKQPDLFLDVRKDKIWYRSPPYIYHIRTFDPGQDKIYGVGLYHLDEQFDLKEFLQADSATFQDGSWVLQKVKATRFDGKSGYPVIESSPSRVVQLKEQPKDFKMLEREVDRLRIKDLYQFIQRNKKSGIDSKSYETKFHSRFSLSFIPLIMCLLALPFSVSRAREGRMGRDLLVAFGLTFLYWMCFSVCLGLGENGWLTPWFAAWSPSMVFGILAIFLIKRL